MNIREATKVMFERYLEICKNAIEQNTKLLSDDPDCSLENLSWLCTTAIREYNTYPIDKLNRWLGFVQGVLIVNRITNVGTERDFSRPIFHLAYKTESLDIPPTLSR